MDKTNVRELQDVVICFSGDSGDGMQLTGTLFSDTSALLGNGISTFPDYPAEIRAPQGTVAGVSGFQVHFGSHRELNPGDYCDVLVAMNPAALKAKYAEAIRRLKESGLPTAQVAAEFGLQPEAFRSYLKEHEPELYARKGMVRTDTGGAVSRRSMEKYSEAMHLYGTTTESVKSLARRFGFNDCSFGQFIRRNFPELVEKHNEIVQKKGKQNK